MEAQDHNSDRSLSFEKASTQMNQILILLPAVALVLLTAIVWGRMYFTRIREIRVKRIPVQSLADRGEAIRLLKDVAGPSENFINLFEIPNLFYAAVIILYVTGLTNGFYLALAWAFVLLRYVHSFIHVTYNRVTHRFTVYFIGTVVLWVIWAMLGADLLMKATA